MKERLEKLYKELDFLINNAPIEDDCTEEESMMYFHMSNLYDSMTDAGYGQVKINKEKTK